MRNLIFILAIILLSCETTVDPQLPDNGSGLVIYSFFRPGSPMKIDIFNTIPIRQTETFQRNKDLRIQLLENGELVEEVIANEQGVYMSNIVPSLENNYSFQTTRDEQLFSATSHIPEPASIAHAKMSTEIKYTDSGQYGYPAEIVFSDSRERINFYSLEVLVQNCNRGCSDDDLTGDLNEVLVEELKINTSGKSITRDYYEYLRTSDFQQEQEESGNLTEPVQIATNITNGLGMFAGYSFSIYTIKH